MFKCTSIIYICIDLQPIVQIYIYLHIRCCLDDAFKMHFSTNKITPWKQISRFPLNCYDLGWCCKLNIFTI